MKFKFTLNLNTIILTAVIFSIFILLFFIMVRRIEGFSLNKIINKKKPSNLGGHESFSKCNKANE